ncbi:hypothetical protein Y032_0753g2071 [Ancylostoma ceylanicum]|nr:hypothetical protein Y032_0753g2071 [Ancylostoma ceylanicum]
MPFANLSPLASLASKPLAQPCYRLTEFQFLRNTRTANQKMKATILLLFHIVMLITEITPQWVYPNYGYPYYCYPYGGGFGVDPITGAIQGAIEGGLMGLLMGKK